MAWRETMAEEEKPDPVKELLKPKTFNQVWDEYAQEQLDAGAEYDEAMHGAFNLNETSDNNLEMK